MCEQALSDVKVEFHTGVADPLVYTCRLLRKAWRQGARVVVTAQDATLATLDRTLWTFEAQEFLPHLRVRTGVSAATLARTPVWLADAVPAHPQCPPVLVNLDAPPAAALDGLTRVIEIVDRSDNGVRAGRQHWRHYRGLGWEPVKIEAGAPS